MTHRILVKWIEPYVLLETLKKNLSMKDFSFDGKNKNSVKADFLKKLKNKKNSIGLYMKNVNKFYLFSSSKKIDIDEIFEFSNGDCENAEDINTPFEMIDMGKAEASFIII